MSTSSISKLSAEAARSVASFLTEMFLVMSPSEGGRHDLTGLDVTPRDDTDVLQIQVERVEAVSVPEHDRGAVAFEGAREHDLTDDEYARVLEILGRTPSYSELGIFSVMWA